MFTKERHQSKKQPHIGKVSVINIGQNKTSINIQTMQRINTSKRWGGGGGVTTKGIGWHFTDKNSQPINMEI